MREQLALLPAYLTAHLQLTLLETPCRDARLVDSLLASGDPDA